MVFGLLVQAASVLIGALYPAYKTFKAINRASIQQVLKWARYWMVFAAFLAADAVAETLFLSYLVPCYTLLKIAFLVWAVSPWTGGSEIVYKKLVAPFLTKHEVKIDRTLRGSKQSLQNCVSRFGANLFERICNSAVGLFSGGAIFARRQQYIQPRQEHRVLQIVEEQEDDDVVFEGPARVIKEEEPDEDYNPGAQQAFFEPDEEEPLAAREDEDEDVAPPKRRTRKGRKQRVTNGEANGTVRRVRRVRADRSVSRGRVAPDDQLH